MIGVNSHWAMRWKFPHLLDATILELHPKHVVVQIEHRCTLGCEIQQLRSTLPLHGRVRYDYADFVQLFEPRNDEAIPLPGEVTAPKDYRPKKMPAKPKPKRVLTGWRAIVEAKREQEGRIS